MCGKLHCRQILSDWSGNKTTSARVLCRRKPDWPLSMGSFVESAPNLLKIAVSTMPGCIVAAKILGFSTGRNSMTLVCANLDARYEDRLGKFLAGSAAIPVTKPSTVACEGSAKGMNALRARNVPLTFVCWNPSSARFKNLVVMQGTGWLLQSPFKVAPYLEALPPLVRVCFGQGPRSGRVASGEHQYVPLSHCCWRLVESSFVRDIYRQDSGGDVAGELGFGLVEWSSRTAEKHDIGSSSSRKGSCCRSSNAATLRVSIISFTPGRAHGTKSKMWGQAHCSSYHNGLSCSTELWALGRDGWVGIVMPRWRRGWEGRLHSDDDDGRLEGIDEGGTWEEGAGEVWGAGEWSMDCKRAFRRYDKYVKSWEGRCNKGKLKGAGVIPGYLHQKSHGPHNPGLSTGTIPRYILRTLVALLGYLHTCDTPGHLCITTSQPSWTSAVLF